MRGTPGRARSAALFGAAAALLAAAHAAWTALGPDAGGAPTALTFRVTFLSVALFAVPAAAAAAALAAPRLGGTATHRAARGAGVAAAAYALGVLVVALVAARPGGFFGPSAALGPGIVDIGPALVFRAAVTDGLWTLLAPALPLGAAAGWALGYRTARRAPSV